MRKMATKKRKATLPYPKQIMVKNAPLKTITPNVPRPEKCFCSTSAPCKAILKKLWVCQQARASPSKEARPLTVKKTFFTFP